MLLVFLGTWATPSADARTSSVLCKTIGTSLQFEEINPLIKAPQPGQGHIKIHCRNHSNKSQHLALAIYQKRKEPLILKNHSSSQITLRLFSDENHQIPVGNRTEGGNALKLHAVVAENTELVFEVPFFAQLVFPKIPEAGEHVQAAEYELVY